MHDVSGRVKKWKLAGGFLIIYVVWGSTYLAIKWSVETIPPFLMAATRFLLAGGMLYAFMRLRGAPRPTVAEWRVSAVIGALLLLIGNGSIAWAELRVDSGVASVIVATVPFWLVLCEAWLGKRPRLVEAVGVMAGLAGVCLLVLPGGGSTRAPVDPVGAVVLAVSAFSWTVGSLYSLKARQSSSAALAVSMQMLSGGLLLLLFSFMFGEWREVSIMKVSTASLLSLLYLVVFGSLIAFSTYMWLFRVARPAAVSTYAYVNPVIAVLLGVVLADERLPARAWVAIIIILGGVALVTLMNTRRKAA